MQVLQRPHWHGSPAQLGELFILTKNGREATCKLRTQDEVLTTGEGWKAAMIEKGWR
jgi:hypothetical protein